MGGINYRWNVAEERISEVVDIAIEITPNLKGGKDWKRRKHNVSDLWNNVKLPNIHIFVTSEEEEGWGTKRIGWNNHGQKFFKFAWNQLKEKALKASRVHVMYKGRKKRMTEDFPSKEM